MVSDCVEVGLVLLLELGDVLLQRVDAREALFSFGAQIGQFLLKVVAAGIQFGFGPLGFEQEFIFRNEHACFVEPLLSILFLEFDGINTSLLRIYLGFVRLDLRLFYFDAIGIVVMYKSLLSYIE